MEKGRSMGRGATVRTLLDRLAAAEDRFVRSEFLAPVVRDSKVHVRIAGIVCEMQIVPRGFNGWGVFQPNSLGQATFLREPRLSERQRYIDLLPAVSLILVDRSEAGWEAAPAARGDRRIPVDEQVPVQLVTESEMFDVIRTRFDGRQFWFESADHRRDPSTADYLRDALRRRETPDRLDRRGLSAEEREAYDCVYQQVTATTQQTTQRDKTEQRLRRSLAHAGAKFVGYVEQDDGYRVTYELGGERRVSAVNRSDLSVRVAGICLSGEDAKFDLSSLIGVLREADRGWHPLRVGGDNRGIAEEEYFRIHPRRAVQGRRRRHGR